LFQVTDNSTAHGAKTPHGFKTPHRFPVVTTTNADLGALALQLYPTGSAWQMPEGSNMRSLHQALNLSFLRLINTGNALIDSTLPDNNNFDANDCTLWEYRLGLITNPALTLPQRRANISRKLSFRSNVKARAGAMYIQSQLQVAGFAVGVYENVFYDGSGHKYYKTPADIIGAIPGIVEHGGTTQHGGSTEHGGGNFDIIANSNTGPEDYNPGGNLWATFFIASSTAITQNAIIPKTREREFRELVLHLKAAHLAAYIFVTYV